MKPFFSNRRDPLRRRSCAPLGGRKAIVESLEDRQPRRRRRDQRKLRLEILESRRLLTVEFDVNTTDDTVDVFPGDGIAADALGKTSLRAAVMEANALVGAQVINMPAGTYKLTIAGKQEYDARTGDLNVKADLTIRGAGAANTIIDATGLNDRIFNLSGTGTVEIAGLTLTGGKIQNAVSMAGGAVYMSVDSLTILDCNFVNNVAGSSGGAIAVVQPNPGKPLRTVVVRNTTFRGNSAGNGGAIWNRGKLNIENSTFVGNTANGTSNSGGAINNNGGADLTLANVTISGNTANQAGAVINFARLVVANSTITNNRASYNGGVLISSVQGTYSSFQNTIIAGNTAASSSQDISGTVTSLGHNLIGNTTYSTGFGAVGDLLNVDPKLGPLADNGGPTQTHALLPDSPALDAGINAGAIGRDQRGQPRPMDFPEIANATGGDGSDIGAFELQQLPGQLTLSASPAVFCENAGPSASTGTVTRTGDLSASLTVSLASSDTTEAVVPASVTIPANNASATFPVDAVDDTLADGLQTVTITATAPGFTTATKNVYVTDYETLVVTTAYSSLSEHGGGMTGTVTRSNSGNLDAALTVGLASSDPSEITVPASVTIPAGALSAAFTVSAVDDALLDGTQQVTVTAAVAGYVSVPATVSVTDYETLSIGLGKTSLVIGGDSTTVTLTRSNTDVADPLTVNVYYEHASDLLCPDTATIPAGQQSVTFDVSTTDNEIVEGTRTIRLWASAPGYYSSAGENLDIREEGVLGLAVAADGFATDLGPDGTFDALDTSFIRIPTGKYPPTFTQPREERGLFEFNLAGLDPTAVIEAASLTVYVEGYNIPWTDPAVVEFYGYAANGVLTLDDATAGTVKLGELVLPAGQELRRYGVPLDAEFVESARQNGYVGIRTRMATSVYVEVSSSEKTSIHPSSRPMLQLVLNHPPVANNQSVSTPEDTPKAIALTASDADGDALTYTVVAGPAHGTLSGTAPDFTYTPAVNYYGTDSFTFKANDGQLDSNVGTVTITVTPVNDAPSLTVSGPASAMRGQSATFTFDASDLTDTNPVGQRFSYSIDWGDGTPIQTVTGDYTIEVAHAFNHVRPSGTYTVAAVVTDEDGSGLPSAPAVTTIAISGAELQGTDLVVVGTSGSDSIQIRSVDTSGDLAVFMAGQIQGVFHPSGWINVYALAGDDVVQIQTAKIGKKTVSVTVPAAIFGAEGGDVLDALGSKANNILVGGDGDDTIAADGGRDLLFGGLGADSLRGGSGDDILVAGLSAYDADLVALRAIWDEWTRTDADYPTRVGHLRGTISGGRNGGYYLTAATASDDAAVDQLLGESGTDWFFYRSLGSLKDVIDRKRGEEVTLIDP